MGLDFGRRRNAAPFLVGLASAVLFAVLAAEAAERERVDGWDVAVEHFLFRWIPEAHGEDTAVRKLVVLFFLALLVLVPTVLARRGRLREASFWIVSFGALDAFGIARLMSGGAEPGEYTFPSPGAMLFGALVAASVPLIRDRRRLWTVVLVGAGAAVVHGALVVDLRLSHPSDVLAGWLVGAAWVTAVWLVFERAAPARDFFTPARLRYLRLVRPVAEENGAAATTRAGADVLLEPNLFLDFDALSQRLRGQLERWSDEASPEQREEIALDCFLLAAGLNQILEDYLHRDVLSLWTASTHLPRPVGAVARQTARLGFRLRGSGLRARRLAKRQRELAALVAQLANVVARGTLREEAAADAAGEARRAAGDVLRPPESFPARLRSSILRLPNCFRSFDQDPSDCLRLVERFAKRRPDRARPILVVGLRTSGNYLAPLHASFLAAAGYRDVRVITMRPRKLLGAAEAKAIKAAAADGAVALVVDDPPRTGSQLAQAGEELRRRGLVDVMLLLQLPGDEGSLPEVLGDYQTILLSDGEWEVRRRLAAPALAKILEVVLAGTEVELPGGHAPLDVAGVEIETIEPSRPRRGHVGARIVTRLLESGTSRKVTVPIYAEGVGLGYFGRHEVAIATKLAGETAPVYGVRNGLLFRAWLQDEAQLTASRLRSEADADSAAIARYVTLRNRLLPLGEDVTLRMGGRETAWEHVGHMLGDAFGRLQQFVRPLTHGAAKRLLRVEQPSVADGSTAAAAWFSGAPGRLRKIRFEERASSNEGFQSCDPVFDLAEAAASAEASGAAGFGRRLRTDSESLTGRAIEDERWLLYRLLHHLGAYKQALREAGADPANGEVPFAQALNAERTMAAVHAEYFGERYFSDLAPPEDGPLCAIDVDGVLETRWVAFPAIGPAGALALRALNVHGYRALLVTGRSLEEVRTRCAAYRLRGAVAEFGSVVYDHVAGQERSLLTRDDVDALDVLRAALGKYEGVYVDPAYRHSVRAHALRKGVRRHLTQETIARAIRGAGVSGSVRVVPGDLQTDFVARGVDKARGLEALAADLGAADEAPALAIGDSESDLPVLALAVRAFAPSNAAPEVRVRAESAGAAYQAGLLRAVQRLLGHSPRRCAACRAPEPPSRDGKLLLSALSALDGGKRGKAVRALSLAASLVRA